MVRAPSGYRFHGRNRQCAHQFAIAEGRKSNRRRYSAVGIFEPATAEANLNEVFDLAQQGVLRPAIARTYALKDFAVALDDVAKGEPAGRIVLTM